MDEWVNALGAQEEQDRSPVGEHTYLCIDLKTFYASVECADRGLDPLYVSPCGCRPLARPLDHLPRHHSGTQRARYSQPLPRL